MNTKDITVTVFTPTYNRDRYIMKLYDSLCKQTVLSFEWIVIDQGSGSTKELIKGIRKSSPFQVRYLKMTGERGIARAFNRMVPMASGKLVFKVDDDDILTPDAVETIIEMEKTLPDNGRYAGVAGLRMYPDGKTLGGEWSRKEDFIDCTNLERGKYGLKGDMAEAYYLKVLKKYGPMPVVPGEYYTWEGVLWDRIADAGKMIRWFNRKIYISEYLPGGLTDTRIRARSENFYTYTILISEKLRYRSLPLVLKLKISCRYFELLREKKIPLKNVKAYFHGCGILAVCGWLGSLFTRRFPEKQREIL